MTDEMCRGLLKSGQLKLLAAVTTTVCNEARMRHGLTGATASLMGHAVTAGLMLAALQKGEQRINLQIECDGPLRGLLVDASAEGHVRGYVRNSALHVEQGTGVFRWRSTLGNSGFLSVLRDIGGEFYRSSVELQVLAVDEDLNYYFDTSEQVFTRIAIEVMHHEDGEVGVAASLLLQALPGADRALTEQVSLRLRERLVIQMREHGTSLNAETLLQSVFGKDQVDILELSLVSWKCTCSKAKVMDTLAILGVAELQDVLATTGSAVVTCQFCNTRHEATAADLQSLIAVLAQRPLV